MPTQTVLQWLDGRGWLVLSGGGSDEICAQALGRVAADGVACVSPSGDPDALLDDIADLGAPSGYLVDVFGEDDQTLRDKLAQAGMIVVVAGASGVDVRGRCAARRWRASRRHTPTARSSCWKATARWRLARG
ncbi:MAG: hypothetical protein U0521_07830 [Anaerolineae bacterium]